jgi:hypothetical protein
MDAADAFWAASIASRFNDRMIEAIVETGQLSDPAAARFLTDVIIRRRDKAVVYWIAQTNPLDRFATSRASTGATLTFDNAAVRLNVAQPGATYQARWLALDNRTGSETAIGREIDANGPSVAIPDGVWGPADAAGSRYTIAAIATIHPRFPNWTSPVLVTLRNLNGRIEVVGVERPTADARAGLKTLKTDASRNGSAPVRAGLTR